MILLRYDLRLGNGNTGTFGCFARLFHRGIEIGLIAKPKKNRIARTNIRRVPVGAITYCLDRVLCRADQLYDLRIL